ncbi:YhdP family protein [Luteimonas sp. 22616]|uniref:YhdP family protein n=1 Tax=Luteimonas sp. 22616 TaxID=3453951 RepID=UPI003F84E874
MSPTLHRHLRRVRRGAWYAVAVVLVVMALVAGIVSQVLLPWAEQHPERIESWLSAQANRSVRFDRVQTQWTRRGPLLRLDGLRIGDGADAVPIGAAEVLVSQYAGLLPGSSFTELRLRGLELTLQRDDDGRWQVRGLPGDQRSKGDPFSSLEGLGELQVIGGKLRIQAPGLGIDAQVPRIDLRLRVDGQRVRIGARAWMRADAAPVEARADFRRDDGNGHGYVAAKQARLSAWSPLLHAAGVTVADGNGKIEAWTTLRGNRIAVATVDADLQALQLRGTRMAPSDAPPQAAFGRVQLRGRWQVVDGGWRFDALRLRIGDGDDAQALDGLVVAGGRRQALLASRIDAGPLLALVALSDRVAPGLRQWLLDGKPDAVLHDVALAGVRGGALSAHVRVEGLRFSTHGDAPGISGLGGTLDGDADGLVFDFDPAATLRFDWPSGFGAPHDVHLAGRVAGWRDGGDWRVETPALRIDGTGYGADVRGGMTFEGDGTRPRIDVVARLDDTQVPVAKRFWVRHLMSPGTLHWLDTALVGGRVLDGRAVVSGDLDDWPFQAGTQGQAAKGRFEATARLAGAVVKFQPDWPAADHLDGDVSFIGNGFTVKGRGAIAGVAIPRLEAGIADFHAADLKVGADAKTDAAKLLALLQRSPLHQQHAETLDNLTASGPTMASLALDLPLHHDAPAPKIDGRVELAGVSLGEKRWKLSFDDVRGAATYDHEGFTAGELRATHLGQPGRLALRAGEGHVRDRNQAFEAEVAASLDAHELLDHAPEMAWLKPYVSGRSPWTVALSIASAAAAPGAEPPMRLRLQSNLEGTRLGLPEPMDKPAATALPTTVETMLPLGSGDIAVAFGQRLALRARSAGGQTGVRVALGSGRVDQAPPASGLVATGRTPTLDAIDWMALTTGGSGQSLPLRRIDIVADRLLLLGGSFPDTRLRAQPSTTGTEVHVDGPRLAGSLSIPRGERAAISGNFARVFWRSASRAASAAGASDGTAPPTVVARAQAAAPAGSDEIDPASVPPLDIGIDELRFGDAVLGKAEVHTRPVAGGLRIERLQTRSPEQRIDVSGDWLGRGASARTRLKVDVHSEDFGALLAGFGYGGRVAGGDGDAHLDATWPGSPAGFRLADLQGRLTLAAKDGRLVEVEPGAGRVLGLLSVAELPRRLMLDFRDFFSKGFAFNRIGGSVEFGNGQARSDDMNIDGPAAEIRIRGSADLRAQTFDQHIEVLPRSGNLLTVAGALAGGPVGAAVGALTNAVLRKPLGEMGAKSYRVTGPWKDPKVEVSGREQAPAQPPTPTAPAPPPGDTREAQGAAPVAPEATSAAQPAPGLPNDTAAPNSKP